MKMTKDYRPRIIWKSVGISIILHGFYKTDTLDLTLTCYDGIGQECVKYENE